MTVSVSQSIISDLRDQLTLDFSDGNYLNAVSANLGVQRPPFGFSDDVWRALVKVVSIQYKQIETKFEAVLSVILGPRVTQCSSFAEPCALGDLSAVLVGTSQFPQVGTMIIDEGLATEESIYYCYIDRYSNRIYFDTPLEFDHVAINAEWESGVIGDSEALDVTRAVFDNTGFPNPIATGNSYTVNVGRGTEYEHVDVMQGVSAMPSRLITLTSGSTAANPGAVTTPGSHVLLTSLATQANVYYLNMQDTTILPYEGGHLQSNVAGTLTATAGTTTSVTVAGPLTTPSPYTGFAIRFTGNVTATLTGRVGHVLINTVNQFFFSNTLPFAPAAGDTFTLISNFQYIRVNKDEDSVLTKMELPDLRAYAASSKFSVVKPTVTAAVAQVQVKSGGWEVIQSDGDHVEIVLPSSILANDLRSASYIRENNISGTSTSNAVRSIGATTVSVTSTNTMPLIGVLNHVVGVVRYAYYSPHTYTTLEAQIGATQVKVSSTLLFPGSGTLRLNGVNVGAYTISDDTTINVPALAAYVPRGVLARDENIFTLAKPLSASVGIGNVLSFYTSYSSGDIWGTVDDLWPGPYVWDMFAETHKKETVPDNSANTYLSGPTKMSVDRVAGDAVLELDNASAFPVAVPFQIIVGENSGNVETLTVQAISFQQRTFTTTSAVIASGAITIPVVALAGPAGPANTFPAVGPYRVVIWTSPLVAEVVEVVSTSTGPNTLLLSRPTVGGYASGARVTLLSDLVRVSPVTADDHLGVSSSVDRFGYYALASQFHAADTVRPVYTSIALNLAGTDFPTVNGNAVFNFGNKLPEEKTLVLVAPVAGDTALVCVSTTNMPEIGYPYIASVGTERGPLYGEHVHVTNNNTVTGTLTLSHGLLWGHPVTDLVVFTPGPQENISYTSKVGSTLFFSPNLKIEYTHQEIEHLAPTVGINYPRRNGFDFPLRIPTTAADRIRYMLDLIRAAGVQLTFISRR